MQTTALRRLQSQSLRRIAVLQIGFVFVIALLGWRLWQLSVVAGSQYAEMARRNRTRLITTDAPRGVMYDRTGVLLVRNMPRFKVLLIPAYFPDDEAAQEAILQRLHKLLDMPLESDLAPSPYPPFWKQARKGLRDLFREGWYYAPYEPIVVKEGVSSEVAFQIEASHLDMPGVLVQVDAQREYLTGSLTAHIVGYMGAIPSTWADSYGPTQGYDPDDRIGLAGLEYSYEQELRGRKGQETIEVDVAGRKVRTVGQPVLPQPGHSLILTLDLDLQRYVEEVLGKAMKQVRSGSAAAIVSNVNTGEILALVSLPTFDNNLFANGISAKDFNRLNTDPNYPLLNHAISGVYPPGSTFKLVPASAALQEGVVGRWTLINCPADSGTIWLPNEYYPDNPQLAQPFYCWTAPYHYGHGRLDIVSAISYSCDTFFYIVSGGFPKLMQGLGLDRLTQYAQAFGYGSPTGIDLPAEAAGLIPSVTWKRRTFGERWTTGDTYNMGIGQGHLLATPLQVHNTTATVANGGTVYQPQVVRQIVDVQGNIVRDFKPIVTRQVPVDPDYLRLVREGMRGAVTRGTAIGLNLEGQIKVAAKTGTAEFCDNPNCRDEKGRILTTHAWFTAFAPYENPEIAVTVFVYGGGQGSETAMPVAREIIRYYFQLY